MGVEPTAAGSAPPATDFEDQGAHRDTCPPADIVLECTDSGQDCGCNLDSHGDFVNRP